MRSRRRSLALALALIGSTALAVRFGLRPLRVLREGVAAIRRGEAEHIAGEFPQDVAPLAAEVNQLIDANREIVERARTQVGNLAHALKTPLSVLMNEADSESPSLSEKVREQTEIMRRQVDLLSRPRPRRRPRQDLRRGDGGEAGRRGARPHLREAAWRSGPDASTSTLQPGLKFRGEAQDLTDLIGNLLDNAGKWARETRVDPRRARDRGGGQGRRPLSHRRDRRRRPRPRQEARAPRRSSAASGSTSRAPAPVSGSSIVVELASIYGGSLATRRKPARGLASDPEPAMRVRRPSMPHLAKLK